VNAEESVATAFARGFAASATVHQRHRLHRLTELVPPDPAPPGAARVATAADRVLLEDWVRAFAEEAGDTIADVPGPSRTAWPTAARCCSSPTSRTLRATRSTAGSASYR
jgi:hypothetical protein